MRAQVILLAVFAMAPALSAQRVETARMVSIEANAKVPLPSSEPTVPIGGIMCDDEGNVYSRLLSGDASKERGGVFRLPIEKITPAGTLAKIFRVTDISAGDIFGKHIFVSGNGNVYQLAIMADGIYVGKFADDGSVKARIKLEADNTAVQAWDIAVFNGGEYLLTGETGKDGRTPYTAVFDADGRVVKNIYEAEDDGARRKAEGGDLTYAPSSRGNRFVSQGAVAAGSDRRHWFTLSREKEK
jgi:hypothetical protein